MCGCGNVYVCERIRVMVSCWFFFFFFYYVLFSVHRWINSSVFCWSAMRLICCCCFLLIFYPTIFVFVFASNTLCVHGRSTFAKRGLMDRQQFIKIGPNRFLSYFSLSLSHFQELIFFSLVICCFYRHSPWLKSLDGSVWVYLYSKCEWIDRAQTYTNRDQLDFIITILIFDYILYSKFLGIFHFKITINTILIQYFISITR